MDTARGVLVESSGHAAEREALPVCAVAPRPRTAISLADSNDMMEGHLSAPTLLQTPGPFRCASRTHSIEASLPVRGNVATLYAESVRANAGMSSTPFVEPNGATRAPMGVMVETSHAA